MHRNQRQREALYEVQWKCVTEMAIAVTFGRVCIFNVGWVFFNLPVCYHSNKMTTSPNVNVYLQFTCMCLERGSTVTESKRSGVGKRSMQCFNGTSMFVSAAHLS